LFVPGPTVFFDGRRFRDLHLVVGVLRIAPHLLFEEIPMRRWNLLPVGLFLLFLALPPVRADDAPTFINIHKPLTSTAMILVPHTRIAAQAPDFIIDDKASLLVTNYHVVGKETNFLAVFPTYENAQARADRKHYLISAPRYRGKVLHRDEKLDLALL